MSKLLIAHGGGATSVINASLYGAIVEAKESGKVDAVWGAVYGSAGILKEEFCDLSALTDEELERLRLSPASAIGTSRTPLYDAEYARMREVLLKHDIGHVLFTGGNGSMDTCGHLAKACKGTNIVVGGIPKTVDNDLGGIDHAPGYGSAARFAAQTMREIATDVASLPIHVCVVEYMGRNAGWITAATALARGEGCTGPDLILLPEIPFDEERFLSEVKRVWENGHGVMVAVSEGLHYADGTPVAPLIFKTDRASYFGDVSGTLANLVTKKLGIKARSEKPGILGRSCPEMASDVDRDEAVRMGRLAARTVLDGIGGKMAGLRRVSTEPYRVEEVLIPVEQVMMAERLFPEEYMDRDRYDVTEEFVRWARPLIGQPLPHYLNCQTPMKLDL